MSLYFLAFVTLYIYMTLL